MAQPLPESAVLQELVLNREAQERRESRGPGARAASIGPRGRRAFHPPARGSTGAEIQMSPGLPQAAYDLGLGHAAPAPSLLRLAQWEGRQTEAGGDWASPCWQDHPR